MSFVAIRACPSSSLRNAPYNATLFRVFLTLLLRMPCSKARNVMLSTGNTDGRGIVGKVGDFGLSLKMDGNETHISQVFQGTLSHMAPGGNSMTSGPQA